METDLLGLKYINQMRALMGLEPRSVVVTGVAQVLWQPVQVKQAQNDNIAKATS